jgi:hypothetical protein
MKYWAFVIAALLLLGISCCSSFRVIHLKSITRNSAGPVSQWRLFAGKDAKKKAAPSVSKGKGTEAPVKKAKGGMAKIASRIKADREANAEIIRATIVPKDLIAPKKPKPFRYFFFDQRFIKDPEKSRLHNIPRKLKRHLRASTAETFATKVYNPIYEDYLTKRCSENMYNELMKKIQWRAKKLFLELDPEFAKRSFDPPDLFSTIQSNQSFSVRRSNKTHFISVLFIFSFCFLFSFSFSEILFCCGESWNERIFSQ